MDELVRLQRDILSAPDRASVAKVCDALMHTTTADGRQMLKTHDEDFLVADPGGSGYEPIKYGAFVIYTPDRLFNMERIMRFHLKCPSFEQVRNALAWQISRFITEPPHQDEQVSPEVVAPRETSSKSLHSPPVPELRKNANGQWVLFFQDECVRTFDKNATKILRVVKAFEKAGWPLRVPCSKFGISDNNAAYKILDSLNNGLSGIYFFLADEEMAEVRSFQWAPSG